MRIGLSSAAAPDASLDDLLDACARRGLGSLELEAGHGHGVDVSSPVPAGAEAARSRARTAGVVLAGYRFGRDHAFRADPDDIAAFALCLGAPLIVSVETALDTDRARLTGGVEIVASLPPGDKAIAALDRLDDASRVSRSIPLAWDVDPGAGDLARMAPDVLARAGRRLRHVRLLGGGPEGSAQEGQGVGALMARLALAGYGGTLALAPSSPRYRVVWSAWLGRRGGWGCGSVAEDRGLVSLVTP